MTSNKKLPAEATAKEASSIRKSSQGLQRQSSQCRGNPRADVTDAMAIRAFRLIAPLSLPDCACPHCGARATCGCWRLSPQQEVMAANVAIRVCRNNQNSIRPRVHEALRMPPWTTATPEQLNRAEIALRALADDLPAHVQLLRRARHLDPSVRGMLSVAEHWLSAISFKLADLLAYRLDAVTSADNPGKFTHSELTKALGYIHSLREGGNG